MNNKIYKKLFVGFGFVSIVLILTLFVMSQTYIQNLACMGPSDSTRTAMTKWVRLTLSQNSAPM